MTNRQFIEMIAPLAIENWKKYKILPSLTIAQACLESNFGRSATMSKYHAYFGIKATGAFMAAGGKCFSMKTKEEYTVGTMTTITDKFRAYDSDAAGVDDHGRFLSGLTRYWNLVGNKDFNDCALKIRQDGYATASAYTDSLKAVYKANDLGQYDFIVNVEQATERPTDVTPAAPAAVTYTVKRGDSFWKIAAKTLGNGARYPEICAANGLSPNSAIHPGDTLTIPADAHSGAVYNAIVTAPVALNVRSGAGQNYARVAVLNHDERIVVQRESAGWAFIGSGWVATSYIRRV